MSPIITKVQQAQQLKPELTHPLYVIDADTAQARADAKALDAALGTSCLSAVNRHVAAEEQVKAQELAWLGNMAAFFETLVGLMQVLKKEEAKPPEQQSHGAHLRSAKALFGAAQRDLTQIGKLLDGWERARSDIVRALAAAQKGLPKKGDEAVKAGTPAAKKEHQALVKSESQLRIWASKQGKLIEGAKKQLQQRLHEASVMVKLFDGMPEPKGTPV